MALSLRLRRALILSSNLLRNPNPNPLTKPSPLPVPSPRLLRPAPFHSSAWVRDRNNSGEGKISPDEILFEGCDYNHWLITMDFPKDPKPTPEQMVETYVETLAKIVGSKEEAMKVMYACSTTTYHGFQAVMTEEMSEKFRGLPGVVFILPDSYIDPVNKEYGGDKYEMGKITPRPPPVQYGRQGRYGDRNRNYDRPRYDRPSDSMPMQQGSYDRQGQQNFNQMGSQQGSPSQDRWTPMQGGGPQQGYGHGGQQGNPNPGSHFPAQGYVQNFAPQQGNYPTGVDRQGYGPQGERRAPPNQGFGYGQQGGFRDGGSFGGGAPGQQGFSQGQGQQGEYRGGESFGRSPQGPNPGYDQSRSGPGEWQNHRHVENTGAPQDQRNPFPSGYMQNDQDRQ